MQYDRSDKYARVVTRTGEVRVEIFTRYGWKLDAQAETIMVDGKEYITILMIHHIMSLLSQGYEIEYV